MTKLRRLVIAALLAFTTTACGSFAAPSATPGSMDDVIGNIVLQDVTVLHLTSGDPGCPSSTLPDNAIHLTVAIGAQSASHEIYLLRWKDQADFDAAGADFAACVSEFKALNPSIGVSQLEASPWRAYGPGWNTQLSTILINALRAAGGG